LYFTLRAEAGGESVEAFLQALVLNPGEFLKTLCHWRRTLHWAPGRGHAEGAHDIGIALSSKTDAAHGVLSTAIAPRYSCNHLETNQINIEENVPFTTERR
jgi:hypothetical protein